MYDWNLGLVWEYRQAFWDGLMVTLQLSAISIALGTLVGYIFGIVLASQRTYAKVLQAPIQLYIVFFGWLPLLIILVVLYYFMPILLDVRLSAYTISWIALSLNLGAFVTDVVRGSINEIPKSYIDAAKAVGMGRMTILRRVVLPEVVRSTLPANVALYINQFKWTTLCSVIGVEELLHKTDTILIHTYRALEAYVAISVIYLIVIGLGNLLYEWLKKRPFFIQRA